MSIFFSSLMELTDEAIWFWTAPKSWEILVTNSISLLLLFVQFLTFFLSQFW